MAAIEGGGRRYFSDKSGGFISTMNMIRLMKVICARKHCCAILKENHESFT